MNLQEVECSYDEITSSTLKLIMEISINKLKNFQNTLQSPTGPFVKSTENKNNLLLNNSNRSIPSESSQRVISKTTSNSSSPSNRLYKIMVILKIAKKARTILLDRQTLDTLETDDKSIDVQNISSSESESSNNSYNTQQFDDVKQTNTTDLSSVQTNICSELNVTHPNEKNEQMCKSIHESGSNNSTVCNNNKRAFSSKQTPVIPEKRAFLNFQSENPVKCDRSLHENTSNLMYHPNASHNTGNIEHGSIMPIFNKDDNEEEIEYDDAHDNDVIIYPKSYPLCKCRLSIPNSEVCSLGNSRILPNELLSNTSHQQINHSIDYDNISNDYQPDMCICLSNSSNSRPLITGII
ncbi:unnamed protein product [Schistosoma turkestanicum]|nr:unnamed protein product [Schistosoma turkestanicum]